jgi:hypothetical protein
MPNATRTVLIATIAVLAFAIHHAAHAAEIVGLAGKCLDVSGGHAVNGAAVRMWECHNGPNQRWRVSDGRIVGIGGKCLDVAGGNSDDGTEVLLWDCHGGDNQRWRILPSVISR